MNELEKLAQLHRALSSVSRLRILRKLIDTPMCVNAITDRLNISQPSVSQHLAVLERAGLVESHRNGCRIHYGLDMDNLPHIHNVLMEIPYGNPDINEES